MAIVESTIRLIRNYFSSGKHGRKVEIIEIKALTTEDRKELIELIKKQAD